MTETWQGKGTTTLAPITKVQVFENTRQSVSNVDSQGVVLVDQYGNPLRNAPAVNQPTEITVTTTCAQILDTMAANTTRLRVGFGLRSGSDLWLYFGTGTGKAVTDCYGPIPNGGLYELDREGLWQGKIYGMVESGTALLHVVEFTT